MAKEMSMRRDPWGEDLDHDEDLQREAWAESAALDAAIDRMREERAFDESF